MESKFQFKFQFFQNTKFQFLYIPVPFRTKQGQRSYVAQLQRVKGHPGSGQQRCKGRSVQQSSTGYACRLMAITAGG